MEDRNASNPISLPRWESFQNGSYETGRDFPAGPYNRMVAKLYATGRLDNPPSRLYLAGGQPICPVDEGRLDNSPARPISVSVQPRLSIDEGRKAALGSRLYSASHLIHSSDQIRQENVPLKLDAVGAKQEDEPARNSSVGVQSRHSIEESKQEAASTRLYSRGVPHSVDKREVESARFFPGPDVARRNDKITNLGLAESQSKDRGNTAGGQPVQEARLDKVPASVLSAEGQSKDLADEAKLASAPAGVIFMCNNRTRNICFQFSLFGLPITQTKLVQRILPGTKLFLFVLDSRELLGVFEAASNGGINLEPKAFGGGFPAQVRFRILRECRPIAERDFKKAIEANYYQRNKFNSELTSQQVADLLQMFCPGGFLEEKVRTPAMSLPDCGAQEIPSLDPAESQSELSMDISPQASENSPPVDSCKPYQHPPFPESSRYVRTPPMEASRDFRLSLMDVHGVKGQSSIGERGGARDPQSVLMEGSRHYYSPSVEGPMLNKPPHIDVRGHFQPSLTEDPRLVQESLVGFQRGAPSYFGEASGEVHHPMAEQSSILPADMRSRGHVNHSGKAFVEGGDNEVRDYLTNSGIVNSPSYTLEASTNGKRSSLYPSYARSSGLQSRSSGEQGQIFNEQSEEQVSFHLKDEYAPRGSLQSVGAGVRGQRLSHADIERGKFDSQDSLQPHVPRSGLLSWSTGLQGQKFNDLDVERSQATVTGNPNSIEQSRLLCATDYSNPVESEVYTHESDVARQQRSEHLDRALYLYDQECNEQNINLHTEDLDYSHVVKFPGQHRPQEDVEGLNRGSQPMVHDFTGRPVTTSSIHMYKRASEDLVSNTSNSYPWKRPYYYNESYEDRMAQERLPSIDRAAISDGQTRDVLQVGDRIDESNSRQLFSNLGQLPDHWEQERRAGSQPSQASSLLHSHNPMARSTLPMQHY